MRENPGPILDAPVEIASLWRTRAEKARFPAENEPK
jgi:hypothetical protein